VGHKQLTVDRLFEPAARCQTRVLGHRGNRGGEHFFTREKLLPALRKPGDIALGSRVLWGGA
jgi:hypothetical protein